MGMTIPTLNWNLTMLHSLRCLPAIGCVLVCLAAISAWVAEGWAADERGETETDRFYVEVNKGWTIEVIDGKESQVETHKVVPIEIGREWEAVLGERFDGRAIYRTKFNQPLPREDYQQWWLEIDGAATAAIVRLDGYEVGRHLGAWTPFRCDITAWVEKRGEHEPLEIEIELDELVGHNTQGFLPIVVPHFGGIWKSVRLIGQKTEARIDDASLRVGGYRGADQLELEVPVVLPVDRNRDDYRVEFQLSNGLGKDLQWQQLAWSQNAESGSENRKEFITRIASNIYRPELIKRWSPADPFLYELKFRLSDQRTGKILDSWTTKAAIREVRTDGRKLLLNGEPLAVRGLLNWGYAPPRLSPTLDEKWMRDELQQAKLRGFNLMKICLWVPPKRYLEIADEMGMLIWMEYPTWHPDFSEKKLLDLKQEFREFFHYDRNHASVLVRSLTCETGPGADLKVIQELYDLAHREVPGAVVEDDSSWIQWNRVSDFYDDHPYGNNHTWRNKLEELDRYIMDRERKPLLLGEAIAGDTWVTGEELSAAGAAAVHAPLSAETLADYSSSLRAITKAGELELLPESSRRYAWLMRKFQIETYRDRFPDQGYVVSVIRDFPLASMGLIDRANQWKWRPEDFDWHRDQMLVLRTPHDRRSFVSGDDVSMELVLVGVSPEAQSTSLNWSLQGVDDQRVLIERQSEWAIDAEGRRIGKVQLNVPDVSAPQRVRLTAVAKVQDKQVSNYWDLWLMPRRSTEVVDVYTHHSAKVLCENMDTKQIVFHPWDGQAMDRVVLTRSWDQSLWQAAKAGARVIMLPDNSAGSLALREHWFLRGGPIAGAEHPFWQIYPREMFRDLQHFDWSGPVMFDSPLTQQVTPIALLWDNHDLKYYRSHLLAFDCRVGKGRWLASTLGLGNGAEVSDVELLRTWIVSIQDDSTPVKALSTEWLEAIESEIGSKAVSLAQADWRFSPDAQDEGVQAKWFSQNHDRAAWKPIAIDRHWEAQGYTGLDGWGWYFAEVEVPQDLKSLSSSDTETSSLYIHFTGADDYFELYVDGKMLGSGGDRELRQTAFELRKSFAVPKESSEDGKLAIAVRILDWQGAGGLFRPIYLSNRPIRETAPVLVEAQ
jgi:hypothetical protein